MCICVCLDNDEKVFHVHSCFETTMRMFSMCICVCLGNDKAVFHVYMCVFGKR